MHFTDDSSEYLILKEIPASDEAGAVEISQRHVLFLGGPSNKYCKKCGYALIYKDKVRLAPFIDYIDGKMCQIVVYKKRFVCSSCKKVYTAKNHSDFSKVLKAREAVFTVITDTNVTMKELAKRDRFAQAMGSDETQKMMEYLDGEGECSLEGVFAKRAKSLREMIRSFHLEKVLLFIPFEYTRQWRCMVCTCNFISNECFLLDILKSNSLEEIEQFCDRVSPKDLLDEIHCDADDGVLEFVMNEFCGADVYIARQCMLDALKRYYRNQKGQNIDISQTKYQKLLPIIRYADTNTWKDKWNDWQTCLEIGQRLIFLPVVDFVQRNYTLIDTSFEYEYKASYLDLLEEISKLRNNSFELMRLRLLYTNHVHWDKSSGQALFHAVTYLYSPLPARPIDHFGVRVSDLVRELKAAREMFVDDPE